VAGSLAAACHRCERTIRGTRPVDRGPCINTCSGEDAPSVSEQDCNLHLEAISKTFAKAIETTAATTKAAAWLTLASNKHIQESAPCQTCSSTKKCTSSSNAIVAEWWWFKAGSHDHTSGHNAKDNARYARRNAWILLYDARFSLPIPLLPLGPSCPTAFALSR
jgi:hypothetical protein